tara:strand:- start:78 stop:506 length:429 start_codon:yes stop_codon:yes gene_type:complete
VLQNRASDVAFRKTAKIENEQFRMAVPPDIRPLVGKVEWTASLGTTDPVAAAAKRGELIAFYKSEVLRLRGQLANKSVEEALRLLDRGFERLATIRGSMDKAIAQQLALLASTVIDSWLPPPTSMASRRMRRHDRMGGTRPS